MEVLDKAVVWIQIIVEQVEVGFHVCSKADITVIFSYIICIMCYGLCGITGYMAFGNGVESDIM